MIKRIALLGFSLALTFGALEVGVRIFRPVGSEGQPAFRMDETIGWVWAPDQHGFIYQINYGAPQIFRSKFETNSLGMRDREYAFEKNGKLRILALGDSFTQGWGVKEQEAFPKVLESQFLEEVEVWNLGVVGYSTDQELELLRKTIGKAKPDLVVLAFYENDIADNTRAESLWYPRYKKPLFELRGDGPGPALSNEDELVRQKLSAEQQSASIFGRFHDVLMSSAVLRLARFSIRKMRYAPVLGSRQDLEAEVWRRNNAYRIAQTDDMKRAWALTEGLLVEVSELCEQHGTHLVVTYIPRALEIIPGILEAELQKFHSTEAASAFDLAMPERTLAEVTARHGIRFFETRNKFLAMPRPESLYLPEILRDGHLSAAGQFLVARTLAEHFRAQDLVPTKKFSARRATEHGDHNHV
jgi:GDSL-like Lipase/Acylhydrolase family